MKIAIIKSELENNKKEGAPKILYDTKPYMKNLKYSKKNKIDIDELVSMYINWKYNKKGISCDYIDLDDIKGKNYDLIWNGVSYWSSNFVDLDDWKRYTKKARTLGNKLVPKIQWQKFADDKCKVHDVFTKKLGTPMTPTVCKRTSSLKTSKMIHDIMKKYKWNRVFLKPQPGTLSRNTYNTDRETGNSVHKTLNKYIKNIKKDDEYKNLVIQRFQTEFATNKHPEIRTLWVGNKLVSVIKTTGMGNLVSIRKTLSKNSQIYKECIKILKHVQDMNIVILRLDWGYDSITKKYFFNEIQPNPDIWLNKATKTFNVEKIIGDRLVSLLKTRL